MICLDEIEKKRRQNVNGSRDIAGEGAQVNLLSILDHGELQVRLPNSRPELRRTVTFQTGSLMVIGTGVFAGIEDIIARRLGVNKSIGFGVAANSARGGQRRAELLQHVTGEDLIEYGMLPELVGRFRSIVTLCDHSVATLMQIFTAQHGVIDTYRMLANLDGFELFFSAGLIRRIAEQALEGGLGARALHAVAHRAVRRAFFEVPEDLGRRRRHGVVVRLGVRALIDGTYGLSFGDTNQYEADSDAEWIDDDPPLRAVVGATG
jgi:ATP-dependent Clp protease ATP-binding subunit ClpX